MSARHLRQEEKELLAALLAHKPEAQLILSRLSDYLVEDMSDGGMGSVRVVGADERHFGGEVACADLRDADGVPLNVAINLDNFGDLFEIDIWKVDFTAMKRYPKPPS